MAESSSEISKEFNKLKSTNRFLIVALIIAAFFLGSLTNKISDSKTSTVSGDSSQTQQQAAPIAFTNDDIKAWAKDIGLNSNDFDSCFDSEKYKANVDKDTSDGATAGVSGTPSFYINGHVIVGAQPYSVFKDTIDFLAQNGDFNNPSEQVAYLVDGNPNNGEVNKDKVDVANGSLPALGNTGAFITIVDFSDFECPFCRRFFQETLSQLKTEYIDTGKAVLYYRHFPLSFHPLAVPFANASECANEQGKFWEMHDKIYTEQG